VKRPDFKKFCLKSFKNTKMIFQSFFLLLGLSLGILSFSLFVIYTDLFSLKCPKVNGRTCNNRGTCTDSGTCKCDIQFSGNACEQTACGGYNENSGMVCFGRGLCSPFMSASPKECLTNKKINWGSEPCLKKVRESQLHIQNNQYLVNELSETPVCLCHPPYGGINCEFNLCPQTSDLKVCGDNGNKSVGLVSNNTRIGDGCQCQNFMSLLDAIEILPSSALFIIQTSYLHEFKLGFCGTPKVFDGALILTQSSEDVKCYCDEQHYGAACEFGVCPGETEHCSGHGNPDFGFGVEIGEKCSPICSGLHCGPPRCPLNMPYKCEGGECVSGEEVHCARGFEIGLWDDPLTLKFSLECFVGGGGNPELCFGSGFGSERGGFLPGLPVNFGEPLLAAKIELGGNGSLKLEYGNQEITLQAPGTFNIKFSPQERFLGSGISAFVTKTRIRGQLKVTPHPLKNSARYRLEGIGNKKFITTSVDSLFESSPLGEYGIFEKDGFLMGLDGTFIELQVCFREIHRCLWRGNFTDNFTRVTPVLFVELSTQVWNEWEDSFWTIKGEEILGEPLLSFQLEDQTTLLSASYLLERSVSKKCICQPFKTKQSVYNEVYINQPTRNGVSRIGDLGLGLVVGNDGSEQLIRGEVTSISPMKLSSIPIVGDAVILSEWEYTLGSIECSVSRCAKGGCTEFTLVETETIEDCLCVAGKTGLICTCTDAFGTVESKSDYQLDKEETCFWLPAHDPLPILGLQQINATSYQSLDSWTFPIECTVFSCNETFHTQDFEFASRCEGDRLVVRNLDLNQYKDSWTVSTNGTLTCTFMDHLGGVVLTNYILSSNLGVGFDILSLKSVLVATFPKPTTVLWVYCDFESVGIYFAEGTVFAISVFIQGSIQDNPGEEDWTTLAKITEDVVHGSSKRSIPLHHDVAYKSVRIHSFFPFALYSFMLFTDQNCTGELFGTPPSLKSNIQKWRQNPPNFNANCKCDDSCILSARNGFCNDALFYNQSGVRPMHGEVCETGTDCTDCGPNTRLQNPATECGTNKTRDLLKKYENQSIASIENIWTLQEFFETAELRFSVTRPTKVSKFIKECPNECPFYTCLDGSCAHSSKLCPPTLYKCKKDGCVRSSLLERNYKCACEEGWSGLQCDIHECTPGDPYTGLIDPHKWCTCNGPSPLKIKPPFELVFTTRNYLNDDEILRINRPLGRISSTDVGWKNIYADKAPYGIPFLRKKINGNTSFLTNCPFRAKMEGLFYELDECVHLRSPDPPFEVLDWKDLGNGQKIIWITEIQYDDAPFRCPSGHCVAHERDCYSMNKIDPLCGGGGVCLSDGTCQCNRGKETFVLTEALTDIIRIPYKHSGKHTNPVAWGFPNNNRYVGEWCRARNCSETDCSPPYGCFPGSPELSFQDREIECPEPFFQGKCARDIHSCREGVVTEPRLCSGNGDLRKRDYRDREYYCECGSWVNSVFKPNGFGGTKCHEYSCQDDPTRIYFARKQPNTQENFFDINNNPLMGKWLGPCGASVGANPDEISLWRSCCPSLKRLEACPNVPCVINGLTSCVPIDQCLGIGRTPKVFTCNGKGRALADGSCLCEKDEQKGTGFTYDLDVYSSKGCFKKIQCSPAKTSGVPCNAFKPCSDLKHWRDLPDISYIKQQTLMLAAREGLPLTNQSIVERLVGPGLENLIMQTFVQLALEIYFIIKSLATDICVYPNETSSNPFGMLPYVGKESYVGPYMKSVLAPFWISNYVLDANLKDGLWSPSYNTSSSDHVLFGSEQVASFPEGYFVDVIRIHLKTNQTTTIDFFGDGGYQACPTLLVPASTNFLWVQIFCLPQYDKFRFDLEYPNEFNLNCKDVNSVLCEEWMQEVCLQIPNAEVRTPGSLISFLGCDFARCCVARYSRFKKTTQLYFLSNQNFQMDELSLFGHIERALPLPPGLVQTFQEKVNQSTICVDEKAFFSPEFDIGGHLSMFKSRVRGKAGCENEGGVLATVLGSPSFSLGYAKELGEACPGDECFVNARDVLEIKQPSNLEHLIHPDCSRWGCFQKVSSTRAYHSDPGDGGQWTSSWTGNQRTYDSIFSLLSQRATNQFNTYAYETFSEVAYKHVQNTDDYTIDNTFTKYILRTDLTDPPQPQLNAHQAKPNPKTVPNLNEIWTNSETCILTLYSVPNCGNWKGPDGDIQGAKYRFVLTPANYDTGIIGQNLLDLHQSIDGTSGDVRRFDECEPACVGGGTDCCYTQRMRSLSASIYESLYYTRSLSMQGGCSIKLTYGNGIQPSNEIHAPPLRLFHPYYFDSPKLHNRIMNDGCHPNLFSVDPSDLVPAWQQADGGNEGNVPLDGKLGVAQLTAIYWQIYFSAAKISYTPLTEQSETAGYDTATLGWENHPFMCSNLDFRITQKTSDNYIINNVIPPGILTPPDISYAMFNVVGNPENFFKQESGTCINRATSLCTMHLPFKRCDGMSSERNYMPCDKCLLKPARQFEWNQQFYFETDFAYQVEITNQTTNDGSSSPPPSPLFFVSHNNEIVALSTIKYLRKYSRMISSFKASEYNTRFEIDYCMKVITTTELFPYKFMPVRCLENLFAVCVRDTLKYTVQIGRQCDVCGDSARFRAIEPGATALTRYPRASRNNDPFGHMVLDHYLDGSLALEIFSTSQIPWDLVYANLKGAQFVFAFPEAREFLELGVSTRPGYTSSGQTSDAATWVDLAFDRWLPYACGKIMNQETGLYTEKCAMNKESCLTEPKEVLMSPDSMPTLLQNFNNAQDLAKVSECGTLVHPDSFHIYDALGGPQPSDGKLIPLSVDPLVLRVVNSNATWTNTGKKVSASFLLPFSLYGKTKCSVSVGEFRLWIGNLSPFYKPSSIVEYISEWMPILNSGMEFTLSHTPNSSLLQVLGYDFRGLQPGSQITLTPLLITNSQTIHTCQNRSFTGYMEPPTSIQSFASKNQCIYTDKDDLGPVGTCYCDPEFPMGGPTCEWPATLSERGKQVCNSFGEDGGMALTQALTKTKLVSDLGVFLENNAYKCKCINPGLMVRTILRPTSAFDYGYIIRNDRLPNVPQFTLVTDIPSDIAVPVSFDLTQEVCASVSSTLPSWNTALEIEALKIFPTPFLVDLGVVENDLVWKNKNDLFATLNTQPITNPCSPPVRPMECKGLNWNNLAFNLTKNGLTDGINTTITYTTSLNVTLMNPESDLVVEMFVGRHEPLTARVNGQSCIQKETSTIKNVYECLFPGINRIDFTRPIIDNILVREIQIFKKVDKGRTTGIF
jgi:hypothetical protein